MGEKRNASMQGNFTKNLNEGWNYCMLFLQNLVYKCYSFYIIFLHRKSEIVLKICQWIEKEKIISPIVGFSEVCDISCHIWSKFTWWPNVKLRLGLKNYILNGQKEVGLQMGWILNGIWNLEAQPFEIRTIWNMTFKKFGFQIVWFQIPILVLK